jgi:hypothetical protein
MQNTEKNNPSDVFPGCFYIEMMDRRKLLHAQFILTSISCMLVIEISMKVTLLER